MAVQLQMDLNVLPVLTVKATEAIYLYLMFCWRLIAIITGLQNPEMASDACKA